MALSVADVLSRGWSKVTGTANATTVATSARIMGIDLVAGTDAASVTVMHGTATNGTDYVGIIKAVANDSRSVRFGPTGVSSTAVSVAVTGTAPRYFIHYVAE